MTDTIKPKQPDWLDLFRAFRMASDPVKVWLGFLGAAFTILMLILVFGLLLEVRQLTGGQTSRNVLEEVHKGDSASAYTTLRKGVSLTWIDLRKDLGDIRANLFTGGLMPALKRASTLQKVTPWAAILLLLLWLPWAYFGGAINRAAAVEYATGERLAALEAREFAAASYSSYLWPPITLILTAAVLLGCLVAAGLAAAHWLSALVFAVGGFGSLYLLVVIKQKTQSTASGALVGLAGLAGTIAATWLLWPIRAAWVGKLLLVAFLPVTVLVALAVILLLLIVIFGRGLMMSAVSYQGTDAFDAVCRAGDYVLRRPWHLGFYTLVGAAYGVPCVALVLLLTIGGFVLASLAVWAGFGSGFGPMYDAVFTPGRGETLAELLPGFLLRVGFSLLCGLVVGWCVAFVQSLRAISYALIRKRVDLADTSEVYLEPGPEPPRPAEQPQQ